MSRVLTGRGRLRGEAVLQNGGGDNAVLLTVHGHSPPDAVPQYPTASTLSPEPEAYAAADRFHASMTKRQSSPLVKSSADAIREKWQHYPAPPCALNSTPPESAAGVVTPSTSAFAASIHQVREAIEALQRRPTARMMLLHGSDHSIGSGAHTQSQCEGPLATSNASRTASEKMPSRLSVRNAADVGYLSTLRALHVMDVFEAIEERDRQGIPLHESDVPLVSMSVISYRMRCARRWQRDRHGGRAGRENGLDDLAFCSRGFPTPLASFDQQDAVAQV